MIQFLIVEKLFPADWFIFNVVDKSFKKSYANTGKLYLDLKRKENRKEYRSTVVEYSKE